MQNATEKCKTSFDNSNIMRTKYSTEVSKNNKDKLDLTFSVIQ